MMQEFIGCSEKAEFLCCERKACCLQDVPPVGAQHSPYECCQYGKWCTPEEGHYCQLGLYCCSCSLKPVETCCTSQNHFCCVVDNCAFPPSSKVPFTLAVLGLACAPACGCCNTIAELKQKAGMKAEGV